MMRYVLGSRASIGGVLGSGRGGGGNGLLTGLVAYWGLDEASGNALDKHSGGLTLTQSGNPGADTGKVYATARTFNGSSQYFSRNSEAALQTGNIDFAIAAWVYLPSVTGDNKPIVYKGGTSSAIDYYLDYSVYVARFRLVVTANGSTEAWVAADTFGAASSNTWYFVAGWHDAVANTLNIAINGGAADSAAHSTGVYAGTGAFAIGKIQAYNKFLSGRIGPVAFWKNRTLDATARAALYNGGAGLAYSAFTA